MTRTHNSFCCRAVALSSSVVKKNHTAPIFGSSLSDSMTPKPRPLDSVTSTSRKWRQEGIRGGEESGGVQGAQGSSPK